MVGILRFQPFQDIRGLDLLSIGLVKRVGRFVEQPYAALWTSGPEGDWRTLAASVRDQAAKLRASRAYTSQLPLLGEHVVRRTARYEILRGGEAVSWR